MTLPVKYDLTVRCGVDHNITLTGEAVMVYEGEFEYLVIGYYWLFTTTCG